MDQAVMIALIAATPPTLVAAAALIVSLRNGNKTQEVHLAINSRFDQWMEMTKKASHAEGVLEEKERERPGSSTPPALAGDPTPE